MKISKIHLKVKYFEVNIENNLLVANSFGNPRYDQKQAKISINSHYCVINTVDIW
jgi:hypothetical protein